MTTPPRDKPWLIRTYAGHSTAEKSNELYRKNLGRGHEGIRLTPERIVNASRGERDHARRVAVVDVAWKEAA